MLHDAVGSPMHTPSAAMLPKLGRYQLLRRIGSGTFGHVFSARDPLLDRILAIKIIRADLPEGIRDAFLERFWVEARLLGKLDHPNIVHIHDAGVEDKTPYIAMELCDGPSLEEVLERRSVEVCEALWIFRELTQALESIHGAGIVHIEHQEDGEPPVSMEY